jgi:APA family basic amino acid/polyamine antiporter
MSVTLLDDRPALRRQLGLAGAITLGLGAILGTGVFVTLASASASYGFNAVIGIGIAAILATVNGLTSAQLAAAIPISGGTYEYACRLVNPTLGFLAGWLFLCAKSASAAAAALGSAQYFQLLIPSASVIPAEWTAIAFLIMIGWIAMSGIRYANWLNALLVGLAISALGCFVGETILRNQSTLENQNIVWRFSWQECLHASALMFVAFTGYGRIATLGEEVREPRKTIPKAVIITLLLTVAIYWIVSIAVLRSLQSLPSQALRQKTDFGLVLLTENMPSAYARTWITLGALAAMLAVKNNLLLGLSRVILAMGRRGDLPGGLAKLDAASASPKRALVWVLTAVGFIILASDFKLAWQFSAWTILLYYGVTHLCALRISSLDRMFSNVVHWFGFLLNLLLTFFIEPRVWELGIAILFLGWLTRFFYRKCRYLAEIPTNRP